MRFGSPFVEKDTACRSVPPLGALVNSQILMSRTVARRLLTWRPEADGGGP
jgi:hypothetical protein